MRPRPNTLHSTSKWEAERALAIAEAEAYDRERAIAKIRLLMRRFGLAPEDIGAAPGQVALPRTCDGTAPAER